MAFVQIGAAVHHYVDEGAKDKPALLFANSLGSDLRMWDPLVPLLAKDFRLIRYDLPGHGLSEAPPPPYSASDLAGDVAGLLDALKVGAAVICGLSVGGVIAQQFAVDYPDRVRALVLCDTGARIGTVASWEERIALVRQKGMGALVEMSMARWFSEQFRKRQGDQVRGYANMVARAEADGYIGVCCALRDADLIQLSASIRQPTLVLCGEQDSATPPDMARQLAGIIPNARLSLIAEAAHISCVEQPGVMAQQIKNFLHEVHIG
jgi:3-oxoadipate enol-lactonase